MKKKIKNIHRDLLELSTRAREQGLWLYCRYQTLWFTPDEAEAKWNKGKFLWGAVNWELRDPKDFREILEHNADRAKKTLADFDARINQSKRC